MTGATLKQRSAAGELQRKHAALGTDTPAFSVKIFVIHNVLIVPTASP